MSGVSNLQLAPGGVITHIYPLTGDEAAIGHDFLKDDKRRNDAIQAVEDRELTLAGPFDLLQGGTAVIGRNPVYLSQSDGTECLWGFSSALILMEDLLGDQGLDSLSSEKYDYELSNIAPETGLRSVFASNGEPTNVEMQSINIIVPNGTWSLRIGMVKNANLKHNIPEWFGALLIAFVLATITRRIAIQPETLRHKVATQTHDLHQLAFYDGLTGLSNRHHFNQELKEGLQQINKSKDGLALLLMDLDHFKEVNDTIGHDMGDILLREAGDRLTRILPGGISLARLGGDEFTLVIIATDITTFAEKIAEDIVEAIGQPFDLQGAEARVSASIGIASETTDNRAPGQLLKCADLAMYEVKRSGRAGIQHYSEAMQEVIALRSTLANDLRKASRAGQLQLLYQPIVSTQTGKVEKAEALLRWHHPVRGLICPSVFVPLAEEFGLIHELGDWVFTEAIQQVREWRQTCNPRLQISINVSPLQFMLDGQITQWNATAKASDIEPGSILIEITESLLLENGDKTLQLLSALEEAGIQLALDDFGTGYSSLSYLKILDVDYLKIDRSLIKNISAESSDLVVCRAILSIAKNMGFDVVAEGVESVEQEHLLRDIDCHYFQGFLNSRPVTPQEFKTRFLGPDQGLFLAA